MEISMAWFWSDARVKKWFDVKGIENLTSTTRGVMVAGIHFMSLELCGRVRGLWFVRMTQQGVKCTAQRYLGVIHGFFQPGGNSQTARNLMLDICAIIRSDNEY